VNFSLPLTSLRSLETAPLNSTSIRTPSIVVIDRGGQARLIEGYVDAETLAQVVADAR